MKNTKKKFNDETKRRCLVDGRIFYVNKKKSHYHHYHGSRGIYRRSRNSKTCCKKCSRILARHRRQYLKISKPKK